MKDQALRHEYVLTHPVCEYCGPLRRFVKGLPESPLGAVEVDHIWGGVSGRWDCFSNLISACRGCHDWKTRNATMGRLIAYSVKVKNHEMNESEFRAISGMIFRGWLENAIDGCWGELLPGFREVAEALLDGLTKAGF